MIGSVTAAIWLVAFVGIGFTFRVLEEWDVRAAVALFIFFVIAAVVRIAVVGVEPIAGGAEARPWLIPIAAIGFFSGDFFGGKFYKEEIEQVEDNLNKSSREGGA